MNLVSMKRDPEKDDRDDSKDCCSEMPTPDYPWGTRLSLEEEQLQKLGIKEIPAANTRVQIGAIGEVTGYREETVDGKVKRCLEIQLVELGVEMPPRPISQRMYPEKD